MESRDGQSQDAPMTALLDSAGRGDPSAAEKLLPLVYGELRRLAAAALAREPSGLTLQPTALVHEAYLRLVGGAEIQWEGRRQFFCAAATAMRRILVDRARWYQAEKHGGGRRRENLDDAITICPPTPAPDEGPVDLVRLNDALERLERHDDRQAQVVLLRYFGGLSIEETARAIGVSEATVKTDWVYARAWLRRELDRAAGPG
jgi:RNA polymerase sigma factor (TIGR02999 family)